MPAMAQTTTSSIAFDTPANWTTATSLSSYGSHNYTESAWSFTCTNSLRNTTSTTDGFPGAFGDFSWRLRNASGSQLVATYGDAMTVSTFGFDVRRWDGSPSPDYTVDFSTDGGVNFTDTGVVINNDYLENSSDWKAFSYTFNEPLTVSAEQLVIRVTNNTGERIMIDNFQWTYVTGSDDVNPAVASLNPSNEFQSALINSPLVIAYDEPIDFGTGGTIVVRKSSDDTEVETISLPSEQVSIDGNTVTIKLSSQLEAGTSYYVDVDAGLFVDGAGNLAPAISGATEWAFTTRAAGSSVLISQYYESGTGRFIELKNLTDSPLPLDGYAVAAWSHSDAPGREGWKNGSESTTRITDLTGQEIPANGTFLIAYEFAAAPVYAVVNNDFLDNGGCTAINGDDSVVLYFSGVDPLGFTLAEVVDAISLTNNEGADISFYRLSNDPGFDFAPGSSILDYSTVWGSKTLAEVADAADTDEWYLKASTMIESLTLTLSPTTVAESAGFAASVATVTRSGPTDDSLFVTILSSNTNLANEEGFAGFVEIPAGESNATFNIDVIDNPWLVGDGTVSFTVSVEGYLPASAELTILDDPSDVPLPLVINEVDADSPGTDVDEFVEIYNNSSEEVALDGVLLVLFNGSGDSSYSAIDLSGYSIPGNGFFVIGSATVPNVNFVAFSSNGLQNGPDAVALYFGLAADFPSGTPVSTSNGVLLDALVYGTNDADATGLLNALTPGQIQANDANDTESMSRATDGGLAFDSSSYVVQTPTPGATNVLPADDLAAWMAGYNVGQQNGFGDDPDQDGLSNALENILGSNPAARSLGVQLVSAGAGELVFQHTLNESPASDLSAAYEWSTDLATWNADGADVGGVSVSFSQPNVVDGIASPALVQLTATVTGTTPTKVFARMKVSQSAP